MDALDVGWLDVLLRLGLAVVFAAVVGVEREIDGHDAGARTHMLLALGAAMFGVLSVGAFGSVTGSHAQQGVQVDPTRIASYVAAGIGFLGGGAIRKTEQRVHGLTTAASLWAVAAIGLASGLGFWPAAVIGSLFAVVTLIVERPLRRFVQWLTGRRPTPMPDDA